MEHPAWLLLLFVPIWTGAATSVQRGRLAPDTRWETSWHTVDSGKVGPTVLVTAGIHGNEPAGVPAARQVLDWELLKGRIIVVPRCNVPGLSARKRYTPGVPGVQRNLNRNFPTGERAEARGEPAYALWATVKRLRPDYALDLHEGYGVRGAGSKSVGSSILRTGHKEARRLQQVMLKAVNADIDDEKARFVPLSTSSTGSLARACADRLGSCAFILETTYAKQAVAKRTRQHRIMVHALLDDLGMVSNQVHRIAPPARSNVVRVARYNGPSAAYNSVPDHFERILGPCSDLLVRRVCPADIADGVLDQFDVVIFPGGSGSGQAEGLGEQGRARVRRFVREGGGYVGICAGAYLATANYGWSLKLIDADSIDRSHWRRGKGTVGLGLTPYGRELLDWNAPTAAIHFAQGPILAPAEREDLQDYTVVARYLSGVGTNGADPKTMIGTPAIVTGTFGEGRVVVVSPHPEQTRELESWFVRMVRWAGGGARP